jgi:peptide/nickel transport system permease protein
MTTTTAERARTLAATPESPRRSLPHWLRALLRNPVSIVGLVISLAFALVALLAPVLAPPATPGQSYAIPRDGFTPQPQAPSAQHPFGTTEGQYDLYYGVIWGTRTAFRIGLLSGIIALVVFSWPSYARLIRGDVLAVKQRDFVVASQALGAPGWFTLIRHVVPNAIYSLLVVTSLDIGTYVLTFAALSFFGLGAEHGYADWGQLLSFARNWIPNLSTYRYILVFPGLALLLFVLGWNVVGDAFRDALDPKMRGYRAG